MRYLMRAVVCSVFVFCGVPSRGDERIDQSGGTQCFGMHCCPSGYAMRGAHVNQNRLLCRQVNHGAEDCFLDFPTQRAGMHACPRGTYLRGIHVGNNVLACCYDRTRGHSELFGEFADGGHQEQGMHACPLHAADTYMTGIHADQDRFLCANAVSPLPPNSSPVNISLNPEQSRSFLQLNPTDPDMWRLAVRNWLWRILDLPTNGPPSVPYFTEPAELVEGGVTRVKVRYSSAVGDGHQGSAYLLFPPGYHGAGSFPAAIVTHGHEDGAKETTARDWAAAHRAAGLYLAQQGVIVIAPDTPSFGEAPVPEEQNCAAGGYASLGCHDSIDWPLGKLPQTYFLDGLAAVGILVEQPGVDRSRVFSIGLSLGSFQSTFLGALDNRVTGGTMAGDLFLAFACLNDPSENHRCQTIPGLINVAIDRGQMAQTTRDASHRLLEIEDLAALIAPRRLLITWGTSDDFWTGSQGSCARTALANAQTIWQRLNLGPLTPNFITGMPHELDDASAFDLIFRTPAPIQRDYGTQCEGMHCCPAGEAMIGAHTDHNQFLCAPVLRTPGNEVCAVDSGTQRQGMHACPVGRYMKGLHVGNNQLTCCFDRSRGQPALANETVDRGTQLQDMHGCFAAGARARIMTGIHVGNNQLLCADRF
jgi:dienelactone hydrolase